MAAGNMVLLRACLLAAAWQHFAAAQGSPPRRLGLINGISNHFRHKTQESIEQAQDMQDEANEGAARMSAVPPRPLTKEEKAALADARNDVKANCTKLCTPSCKDFEGSHATCEASCVQSCVNQITITTTAFTGTTTTVLPCDVMCAAPIQGIKHSFEHTASCADWHRWVRADLEGNNCLQAHSIMSTQCPGCRMCSREALCADPAAEVEWDCQAGLNHWEAGWSDAKKMWCCNAQQLGCTVQEFGLTGHVAGALRGSTSLPVLAAALLAVLGASAVGLVVARAAALSRHQRGAYTMMFSRQDASVAAETPSII